MERALPQEHSTQPSGTGEVTHLRCWSQELELGCLFVCAEGLAAKPSGAGWGLGRWVILLPSAALSVLGGVVAALQGEPGVLGVWKRRQDCSQKQLGGDLHAGTGTWESLLSVMMQVRLSITTAVRPGARAREVNAPAHQEPSWAALFVGSWLMQ